MGRQPGWFDLLPRRVARRLSGGTLAVLVGTCWLAPSAFQSGFHRFTDYVTSKITAQLHDVFTMIVDVPTPIPTPTPPHPDTADQALPRAVTAVGMAIAIGPAVYQP